MAYKKILLILIFLFLLEISWLGWRFYSFKNSKVEKKNFQEEILDGGEEEQKTGSIGQENDALSLEKICANSGGEWRQFNDGCADKCGVKGGCIQVLEMGCDCGSDKCWNGETCVLENSTSKEITPSLGPVKEDRF